MAKCNLRDKISHGFAERIFFVRLNLPFPRTSLSRFSIILLLQMAIVASTDVQHTHF